MILEHTPLKMFAPDASILVQNSPKFWRLGLRPDPAGGAHSAPPDPLAAMVWDEDLITTLVGSILCPLLVTGPLAVFRLATGLATVYV